jgi:hypothetical protein
MHRSEFGRITFKAILSLAFIGAVIFASIKILPVYVNDYEISDYIDNQAPFWLTQRASADGIRKNILAKADDLGLPMTAEDIKVEANPNHVTVSIDYHVPVDLKVYTLPLHFTHSKGNTAIQ